MQGDVGLIQVGQDRLGQWLVKGQTFLTRWQDVGVGVIGMFAEPSIFEIGPAMAFESHLPQDNLLLEGVLTVEPGSITARFSGENVTFDGCHFAFTLLSLRL